LINTHTKPSRNGFTLIELLVVIAIVAVLASILLSVFSRAKERARRASCQSNLKQIALAMQQYVQDNGGVYPPMVHQDRNPDGTPCNAVRWFQSVYPYVKMREVFYCPSAPADAPAHAEGVNRGKWEFVDYGYDITYLNNIYPGTSKTAYLYGVAEATLATPASIPLNEDPYWVTENGIAHFWGSAKTSCGYEAGGSTLHNRGGNYSFVDGHVNWLTPEEVGEVYCLNGSVPAPFKD